MGTCKSLNGHPTQPTPAKVAVTLVDVDSEMVPLVNWLNSYPGVSTQFCCQGDPGPEPVETPPYILFTCRDSIDLICVLSIFQGIAKVVIHWSDMHAQLEYVVHLPGRQALSKVNNRIQHMQKFGQRRYCPYGSSQV